MLPFTALHIQIRHQDSWSMLPIWGSSMTHMALQPGPMIKSSENGGNTTKPSHGGSSIGSFTPKLWQQAWQIIEIFHQQTTLNNHFSPFVPPSNKKIKDYVSFSPTRDNVNLTHANLSMPVPFVMDATPCSSVSGIMPQGNMTPENKLLVHHKVPKQIIPQKQTSQHMLNEIQQNLPTPIKVKN